MQPPKVTTPRRHPEQRSPVILRSLPQPQGGHLCPKHHRDGDAVPLRAQALSLLPPHLLEQPEASVLLADGLFGLVVPQATHNARSQKQKKMSLISRTSSASKGEEQVHEEKHSPRDPTRRGQQLAINTAVRGVPTCQYEAHRIA